MVVVGPDREIVETDGFGDVMLEVAAVGREGRWTAVLVCGVMDEGVLLIAGLEGIGLAAVGL